jgi:acetyl esterase/lipase
LRTLRDALRANGIEVEYRELAGVGHQYPPLVAAATAFFDSVLSQPSTEQIAGSTAG